MAAKVIQLAPAEQVETQPEATIEINVRERRDALSVSRAVLEELTGISRAAIWRCEEGRGKQEELQVIAAALDNVEQNGLPEHLRRERKGGRRSEATQRLDSVKALVEQALGAKTRRDVDDLLRQALSTITGETGEA